MVQRIPNGNLIRDALLVVLAACAGALDATAYLRLHAFTANMTGNTVLFGLALGGRHFGDATHSASALGAFVAGAFVGTLLGRKAGPDDRWPAAVVRSFALEIALLLAGAALWQARVESGALDLAILTSAAAAMGVQSAITRHVHGAGASTTYMSGTVAHIGEYVADTMRLGFRGGLALNGAVWVVYLGSAYGVGTLDVHGGNVGALLWIVALVVLVVAVLGRTLLGFMSLPVNSTRTKSPRESLAARFDPAHRHPEPTHCANRRSDARRFGAATARAG